MSETPGRHDGKWQEGRRASLRPSPRQPWGQLPGFPLEGGEHVSLQLKPAFFKSGLKACWTLFMSVGHC